MNIAAFCQQLDNLFELDPGTVTPEDSLQEISGWSSLTFMGLIAMVDEEYGITLKPAVVLRAGSVADLAAAIGGNSGEITAVA